MSNHSFKEELIELLENVSNIVDSHDLEEIMKVDYVIADLNFVVNNCITEFEKMLDKLEYIESSNIIEVSDLKPIFHEVIENLQDLSTLIESSGPLRDKILKDDKFVARLSNYISSVGTLLVGRILPTVHELRLDVQNVYDSHSLKGRSGYHRRKHIKEVERRLEFIYQKVSELNLNLVKLRGSVIRAADSYKRITYLTDKYIEYASNAAYQLKIRLIQNRKGIYTKELVDILTGIQSVTSKPVYETVAFQLKSSKNKDEEDDRKDLDILFHRYPPFEPIPVRDENDVYGSFLWYIPSPSLKFIKGSQSTLVKSIEYDEIRGMIKLISVKPVNVLESSSPIILELKNYDERPVWIKYGSQLLKRKLEECRKGVDRGLSRCVQKDYDLFLSKIKRPRKRQSAKTYSASNLSYVWYCILGYGMSTDPWDVGDCPFRRLCYIGKKTNDRRCRFWSYNRRIFPKVYVQRDYWMDKRNVKLFPKKTYFYPLYGTDVQVRILYKGVRWIQPSLSNYQVYLEFEKPILKILPRTNIVGFAVPLKLLDFFADGILDNTIDFQEILYIDSIHSKSASLRDILLSKFFIWYFSGYGSDLYRTLRNSSLAVEYTAFIKELMKSESLRKLFRKYIYDVFGHTMSHLLLAFLSYNLELDFEDLIYHYIIDKEDKLVYIIVAENSPYGVLDLIKHVEYKFNTIHSMLEYFIKNVLWRLNDHDLELSEYHQNVLPKAKQKYLDHALHIFPSIRNMIEELENYYSTLLQDRFILDSSLFSLHVTLAEKYKSRKSSPNQEEIRELGTILSYCGPSICVDGCIGLVMFNNGCHNSFSQSLTTSKNFIKMLLETFYESRDFIVKGGKNAAKLIEHLVTESIFIVSPYLDDEGVNFLNNLSKKGIDVTLITRKSTYKKFSSRLKGIKIGCPDEPIHEKRFVLDGYITIVTSWNVTLNPKSSNTFTLKIGEEEASRVIKRYMRLDIEWMK